eukprot:PhM_4_TR9746/c5_g1_i1/m.99886
MLRQVDLAEVVLHDSVHLLKAAELVGLGLVQLLHFGLPVRIDVLQLPLSATVAVVDVALSIHSRDLLFVRELCELHLELAAVLLRGLVRLGLQQRVLGVEAVDLIRHALVDVCLVRLVLLQDLAAEEGNLLFEAGGVGTVPRRNGGQLIRQLEDHTLELSDLVLHGHVLVGGFLGVVVVVVRELLHDGIPTVFVILDEVGDALLKLIPKTLVVHGADHGLQLALGIVALHLLRCVDQLVLELGLDVLLKLRRGGLPETDLGLLAAQSVDHRGLLLREVLEHRGLAADRVVEDVALLGTAQQVDAHVPLKLGCCPCQAALAGDTECSLHGLGVLELTLLLVRLLELASLELNVLELRLPLEHSLLGGVELSLQLNGRALVDFTLEPRDLSFEALEFLHVVGVIDLSAVVDALRAKSVAKRVERLLGVVVVRRRAGHHEGLGVATKALGEQPRQQRVAVGNVGLALDQRVDNLLQHGQRLVDRGSFFQLLALRTTLLVALRASEIDKVDGARAGERLHLVELLLRKNFRDLSEDNTEDAMGAGALVVHLRRRHRAVRNAVLNQRHAVLPVLHDDVRETDNVGAPAREVAHTQILVAVLLWGVVELPQQVLNFLVVDLQKACLDAVLLHLIRSIRSSGGALSVLNVLLLNRVEELFAKARDDAGVLLGTHHCIRFSGASLSVRKQTRVVALPALLDRGHADGREDVLLGGDVVARVLLLLGDTPDGEIELEALALGVVVEMVEHDRLLALHADDGADGLSGVLHFLDFKLSVVEGTHTAHNFDVVTSCVEFVCHDVCFVFFLLSLTLRFLL